MSKTLLRFSLPLVVTALLIPFANWWMTARLAASGGVGEVGAFAAAYGLIQILLTIVLAAGVPLIPVVAEASADHDGEALRRIVARGTRCIVILLFVPAFFVGANARGLTALVYGNAFSVTGPALFQFAVACLPLGVAETMSRSSVATGKVKIAVGGHLVWLVTILTLVEVYGRTHGAIGCARCLLLAESAQSIFSLYVWSRLFRLDVVALAKTLVICSTAMAIAYYLYKLPFSISAASSIVVFLFTSVALWKWALAEEDKAVFKGIPIARAWGIQ